MIGVLALLLGNSITYNYGRNGFCVWMLLLLDGCPHVSADNGRQLPTIGNLGNKRSPDDPRTALHGRSCFTSLSINDGLYRHCCCYRFCPLQQTMRLYLISIHRFRQSINIHLIDRFNCSKKSTVKGSVG